MTCLEYQEGKLHLVKDNHIYINIVKVSISPQRVKRLWDDSSLT